jgi:hypothetical protein
VSDTVNLDDYRDQLLQAIAAMREEEQRQQALAAGREKAREQSWAVAAQIREAEAALKDAQVNEPIRLAYDFAAGIDSTTIWPVEAAQDTLAKEQAEYDRILHLEQVLDSELSQIRGRLRECQSQLNAALAALVCNSEAFHSLFRAQTAAWARLRGIRKCFREIERACNGYMPAEYSDSWQATVSLNLDAINLPTEDAPAQVWRAALAELAIDPDAELPGNV